MTIFETICFYIGAFILLLASVILLALVAVVVYGYLYDWHEARHRRKMYDKELYGKHYTNHQ